MKFFVLGFLISLQIFAKSHVDFYVYPSAINVNYEAPKNVFSHFIINSLSKSWSLFVREKHILGHMALVTQCESQDPKLLSIEAQESADVLSGLMNYTFGVWFESVPAKNDNLIDFNARHLKIAKSDADFKHIRLVMSDNLCDRINQKIDFVLDGSLLENYNLSMGNTTDYEGGVCSDIVFKIMEEFSLIDDIASYYDIDPAKDWYREFLIPNEYIGSPTKGRVTPRQVRRDQNSAQWPKKLSDDVTKIRFVDPNFVFKSLQLKP